MTAVTETGAAAQSGLKARIGAYVELGKLRLSSLAIFAVIAGVYLGYPGSPPFSLVIGTTIGTLLVAMGGNALNMAIEREHDQRMGRTEGRPLPTGRLRLGEAIAFGVVCALLGLSWLWFDTNPLATATCGVVFITYVFVYTPLKRITPMNTIVGAVPGALPPVVGYVAATGRFDIGAMALFLILFFWQIPHFLAISWRYREDYAKAGMKMLTVTDPDGSATRRQMLVYTLSLLIASILPTVVGLAGEYYLVAAILLGVLFLTPVVLASVLRWESAMRATFLASIVYLPLLFLAMVLDRT